MKFKLFKTDGSSAEDRDIENFPSLDEGKGVDALRQCIIAVRCQYKGKVMLLPKLAMKFLDLERKIYRQKGLRCRQGW